MKHDRNIHKAMIITARIYQMNKKLFVTVQPKNEFKLNISNNLWLPIIDKPQSDIIVFANY